MRHKTESPYLIISLIPIGGGIIGILINVMSRLSRIETDVKWIKRALNDRSFLDPPGEK